MSGKRHEVRVDRSGAGRRLDAYVARRVAGLTRSRVKRLAEEGRVTVDGRPVKGNTHLRAGQIVVVEVETRRPVLKPVNVPLEFLYEDRRLIAVNKPAGLAVHPSETLREPTLVEALLAARPEIRGVGERMRPGLVHRLDKETSGVLLAAKERVFQRRMMQLFASHRVLKYYAAITSGVPRRRSGTVDTCIVRHPAYRQRFTVAGEGRRSITRWRLVRAFGDRFALVVANPITGRTHQVRVHMRHLSAPVLCDKLYSSRQRLFLSDLTGGSRPAGETPLLARQALHAVSVSFVHPESGRFIRIKAPLPADMSAVLNALAAAFPR